MDETYSQMGSDVFRAANVSQPSKSVSGPRQQAASLRRLVEMKSQKIAKLPEAQRAASRAELDQYIATHAPASIPTPARRTGGAKR